MDKITYLFKKIKDTKGIFHAKLGTIKNKNGMDLTEAENIKNRWQEYKEELLKKNLHDPDNHNGISDHSPRARHPEMQSQVGLRKHHDEKASGGDGIPVEVSQILKDDSVKALHSTCQQIWKTQQWPQDQKRSVFITNPKKGNAKACSNYWTIALISHASKARLKIPQARLQQYVNFQMFKLDLEKAEEPEIKLPRHVGTLKKWNSSRSTFTSALFSTAKPLHVWITTNCVENSSRDGNIRTPYLPPEK